MTKDAIPAEASGPHGSSELLEQNTIGAHLSTLVTVAAFLEFLAFLIGIGTAVAGIAVLAWKTPIPPGYSGLSYGYYHQGIGLALLLSAPFDGLLWWVLGRTLRVFCETKSFEGRVLADIAANTVREAGAA